MLGVSHPHHGQDLGTHRRHRWALSVTLDYSFELSSLALCGGGGRRVFLRVYLCRLTLGSLVQCEPTPRVLPAPPTSGPGTGGTGRALSTRSQLTSESRSGSRRGGRRGRRTGGAKKIVYSLSCSPLIELTLNTRTLSTTSIKIFRQCQFKIFLIYWGRVVSPVVHTVREGGRRGYAFDEQVPDP